MEEIDKVLEKTTLNDGEEDVPQAYQMPSARQIEENSEKLVAACFGESTKEETKSEAGPPSPPVKQQAEEETVQEEEEECEEVMSESVMAVAYSILLKAQGD